MRTLASHRGYYERWAKTWEFQALLKARPVAGDLALGREYVEVDRPAGVVGVRARRLRRRGAGDASPGARAHPGRAGRAAAQARVRRAARRRVRRPAAADGARPDRRGGAAADDAERAGRSSPSAATSAARTVGRCTTPTRSCGPLEHRIQLHQLRRTHVVPEDEASLRRLGPLARLHQGPGRASSTKRGTTTGARCAGCTRSCSTGRCSRPWRGSAATRSRLSPEAARARLAALGYLDPEAALRHLEALTAGVTPDRADPAHAAAGDARVVRRRARPRRRAVRLPPDLRGARRDALVPPPAARRGRGRPADGAGAGHQPLRHRPAAARAPGRGASSASRRRLEPLDARPRSRAR